MPRAVLHSPEIRTRQTGRRPNTTLLLLGTCDIMIAASVAIWCWYTRDSESISLMARICSAISIVFTVAYIAQNFQSTLAHAEAVIQAAFVFWYLVPILVWEADELTGIFIEPSAVHISIALIAVFAVKGFYGLSTILVGQVRLWVPSLPNLDRGAPISIIVALALIGAIPLFIGGGGLLANLSAGRTDGSVFRNLQMNDGSPWMTLTGFVLHVAAHLSALSYLLESSAAKKKFLLLVAVILIAVICVTSGTRTMLFVLVMPSLSIVTRAMRIRLRHLLVSILFVASMVVISEAMLRYRNLGFDRFLEVQASDGDVRVSKDNDFYSELIYSVALFPDVYPFSFESPVVIATANLVPRAWWPAKFDAKNSEHFMRVRMNQPSGELLGNILPGIIGQYWQIAGFVGFFPLVCWLRVLGLFSTTSINSHFVGRSYLGYLAAWTTFISFRNLAGGLIVPLLLTSLSVVLIELVFRGQAGKRPRRCLRERQQV
jgi:hypothetical protein